MTAAEKITALVTTGLAEDRMDAAAQLADMGEIAQATADRLIEQEYQAMSRRMAAATEEWD